MFKLPENFKQKAVLFVGSNNPRLGSRLDKRFQNSEWRMFHLDNTEETRPEIISSYTSLESVGDGVFDAVCITDLAQRLFVYEAMQMFRAAKRVLKEDGFIFISVPDVYVVAEHIIKAGLEGAMYTTVDKIPIRPYDYLYGLTSAAENDPRFNHKSGYVALSLGRKLAEAGFADIKVKRDKNRLYSEAYKRDTKEVKNTKPSVFGDDVNDSMRVRDALDKEPKIWNGETFRKALSERGVI
jgi:SAM-dependent methyltransferase